MRAIDAVRRSGVAVEPGRGIGDVAAVMERSGVGALAVIDGERLVGIVTDRDLVRRAMARDLPADARVDDVMSTPVVTVDADSDVHEAFPLLRRHRVRRLAVVRDGKFVGMLSADDLLVDLASDLADLSRPASQQIYHADHDSPPPATLQG